MDNEDRLLRFVHTGATKRFDAQDNCQLCSLVSYTAVHPLKHELPWPRQLKNDDELVISSKVSSEDDFDNEIEIISPPPAGTDRSIRKSAERKRLQFIGHKYPPHDRHPHLHRPTSRTRIGPRASQLPRLYPPPQRKSFWNPTRIIEINTMQRPITPCASFAPAS